MSSQAGKKSPVETPDAVVPHWITNGTFLWGASAAGVLEQAVALFPGGLLTTAEVRSELERHIGKRPFLASAVAAVDSGLIALTALDSAELKAFAKFRSLWQITSADSKDLGEATVITVATQRKIGAIIDDAQARLFMEYHHGSLPLLDTPQVLLHLVEAGLIDMERGWDLLNEMRDKGGFNHRFATRPKSHWMDRRDYTRLGRL